jgi:hypothetical protein
MNSVAMLIAACWLVERNASQKENRFHFNFFIFKIMAIHFNFKNRNLKNKAPPRFELGSKDSKSFVLTTTPWSHFDDIYNVDFFF